jgi:uncharacterized protein YfaP (DUF2135 family)
LNKINYQKVNDKGIQHKKKKKKNFVTERICVINKENTKNKNKNEKNVYPFE